MDPDFNVIPAVVEGRLQDLLDSVENPSGRILNALDLPMCQESTTPTSYSTDTTAWHHTRGYTSCSSLDVFPTPDVRWALAGTDHTFTFFHIDSDGFNTFLKVICGKKLWMFYSEMPEMPLSSRKVYLDEGFQLDRFVDEAKYKIEGILLSAGDML